MKHSEHKTSCVRCVWAEDDISLCKQSPWMFGDCLRDLHGPQHLTHTQHLQLHVLGPSSQKCQQHSFLTKQLYLMHLNMFIKIAL